ncbi:MAG: hypothetical protein HN348_04515 [Proteobacteria bacterium]|jgi:hypothetical protein|nr:hypothetical protein [Pseudomonadota bacterium]
MSCAVFREALYKLPIEDFDGLQAHLSICTGCSSVANELRQGHGAVSDHLDSMIPDLDFDAVWEQSETEVQAQSRLGANNGRWVWAVAVAASTVLGLGVGYWFGTQLPTELEWASIEADVANVVIQKELRLVEDEQHDLEARWERLESQRLTLHAAQKKARFLADMSALAAEQQRLNVETSTQDSEVDWALWRAAEKEARAMADMARNADYAYTNAVLLASRAKP